MTALRILPLALILVCASADAKPMLGDRWPLVGFDKDDSCQLALRSNPVAVRIEASGFIPGETLRIVIRNGGMKPLKATLLAGSDGRFTEYYAPLKSNFGAPLTSAAESGTVDIQIEAARCTLKASSPWTRWRPTIP